MLLRLCVFVSILMMAPGAAPAHLFTPYARVGDTLADAPQLALVRATTATRTTPEGGETAVERVSDLVGESAVRFTLVQRSEHAHALEPGQIFVAPLARSPAGRWLYTAETERPLLVAAGETRAIGSLVAEWRTRRQVPVVQRLTELLALCAHPTSLGRRLGFEALSVHAAELAPRITAGELEALGSALLRPDLEEGTRAAYVRILATVGGPAGADELARRFGALSPPRIQHLAAGVIAQHATPLGLRTLERCAVEAAPPVAARCRRLQARTPPR